MRRIVDELVESLLPCFMGVASPGMLRNFKIHGGISESFRISCGLISEREAFS